MEGPLWLSQQGRPPRGWEGVARELQLVKDPAPKAEPCWAELSHPLLGAPRGFLMRPHDILMTGPFRHSAVTHCLEAGAVGGGGGEIGLHLASSSPPSPHTHTRRLRPSRLP